MPFEPVLGSDLFRQELQNLRLGLTLLLTEPDASLDQCVALVTVCGSRLAELVADLCPLDSEHREIAQTLSLLFLKAADRLK